MRLTDLYLDDNNVVQKLYEKHSHFAFFKIKTNSEFLGFDQTPSTYVASFYSIPDLKRPLLLE